MGASESRRTLSCIVCNQQVQETQGLLCPRDHLVCSNNAANDCLGKLARQLQDPSAAATTSFPPCPRCKTAYSQQAIGKWFQRRRCGVCQEDRWSGAGLSCSRGHFVCFECLPRSLNDSLVGGRYPSCAECKTEYPPSVETWFNEQQKRLSAQLSVRTAHSLPDQIVSCLFCNNMVIFSTPPLIFTCDGCQRSLCTVCQKESDSKTHESHLLECGRLQAVVQDIKEAVDNATTLPCPGCGTRGVKDDNCTHITCAKCRCVWCYMCGKKGTEVDRGPGTVGLMGHSVDWQTNRLRCPIYLQELREVDARYSNVDRNGKEATEIFHRDQLLFRLAVLYHRDSKAFELCIERFPAITQGLSVHEIRNYTQSKWMENRRGPLPALPSQGFCALM